MRMIVPCLAHPCWLHYPVYAASALWIHLHMFSHAKVAVMHPLKVRASVALTQSGILTTCCRIKGLERAQLYRLCTMRHTTDSVHVRQAIPLWHYYIGLLAQCSIGQDLELYVPFLMKKHKGCTAVSCIVGPKCYVNEGHIFAVS